MENRTLACVLAFLGSMLLFALVLGAVALLALWSWEIILFVVLGCPIFLFVLLPEPWWRKGVPPPWPSKDLDRRRRAWKPLSELYLDTELMESDTSRIASKLLASGYTLGQLDEILFRELHPNLISNLLDVAGEWAGFDQNALEKRILARTWTPLPFALIFGKWIIRRSGWTAIKRELVARGLR